MLTSYSKQFKENREIVIERDNHTCQQCFEVKPLDVAHIIPLSMGGTDSLDNLVAMCEKCHYQSELARRGRKTIHSVFTSGMKFISTVWKCGKTTRVAIPTEYHKSLSPWVGKKVKITMEELL